MSALTRRALLGAAAAMSVAVGRARAAADLVLLVGGPEGGLVDGWAGILAPPLGQALAADSGMRRVPVGGLDGVTAANELEAHAVPDGETAALLPGAAGHAWLIGDPRVHFSPPSWIPMVAVLTPSVLAMRLAPGASAPGPRPRVAVSSGPEIAALLALSLLGLEPQPVWLAAEDALPALAARRVDAVLLRGRHMDERIAALPTDVRPFCALSGEENPARTEIADFNELHQAMRGAAPAGLSWQALRAVCVAGRLEAGLILPALTPAARQAQWRQACLDSAASLTLQQVAMDAGAQLVGPGDAPAWFATLAADAPVRDELRAFIGRQRPA